MSRRKKIPVYIPYAREITLKRDNTLTIEYNGGTFCDNLYSVHSLMLYGSAPKLDVKILERFARARVPIVYYRRNLDFGLFITDTIGSGFADTLTKQILVRENKKKSRHIARKLLQAKFESMQWLKKEPVAFAKRELEVDDMRIQEAHHARDYWERYYRDLGFSHTSRRNKDNVLTSCLDATSKFVYGVILRWLIYHNLSPHHGFLHVQTTYPALAYDLFEPYRGYFDKTVFNTFKLLFENGVDEKEYVSYCIDAVKDLLNQDVYVNETRQVVTFQELLHGSVIALLSYLEGETRGFLIPRPGRPNGGRPMNVPYRLYGRSAGKTDFWHVAHQAHEKTSRLLDYTKPSDLN